MDITQHPRHAELDAIARQRLGKPLADCTVDDLLRARDDLMADAMLICEPAAYLGVANRRLEESLLP